mgnify:CR=1 FL=1
MKRAPIGLFYGSSTCYTEMSAEKIQQCFGQENVDLFNIADTAVDEIDHYQQIIFGILLMQGDADVGTSSYGPIHHPP